jgi:hypothetical protein
MNMPVLQMYRFHRQELHDTLTTYCSESISSHFLQHLVPYLMRAWKKAAVNVWLRFPPLALDPALLRLRPSIPERYKERWQLLCSHANTRVGLRDFCVITGFA